MRLAFLFLCGCLISPKVSGESARVTGDSVNVRVGASVRAEVVGNLQAGDLVELAAREGEWTQIFPPPGFSAYISGRFVRNGEVSGTRVNYRSGPGLAYACLGQLEEGSAVQILETRGEWLRFPMPASARLWVATALLEAVNAPGEQAETVSATPDPGGIDVVFIETEPTPLPVLSPTAPPPLISHASSRPEILTKVGYIRQLPEPENIAGREVGFQLVEQRPAVGVLAWLYSESIELSRYRDRRIRIYALEAEANESYPLLEVKGLQVLW